MQISWFNFPFQKTTIISYYFQPLLLLLHVLFLISLSIFPIILLNVSLIACFPYQKWQSWTTTRALIKHIFERFSWRHIRMCILLNIKRWGNSAAGYSKARKHYNKNKILYEPSSHYTISIVHNICIRETFKHIQIGDNSLQETSFGIYKWLKYNLRPTIAKVLLSKLAVFSSKTLLTDSLTQWNALTKMNFNLSVGNWSN